MHGTGWEAGGLIKSYSRCQKVKWKTCFKVLLGDTLVNCTGGQERGLRTRRTIFEDLVLNVVGSISASEMTAVDEDFNGHVRASSVEGDRILVSWCDGNGYTDRSWNGRRTIQGFRSEGGATSATCIKSELEPGSLVTKKSRLRWFGREYEVDWVEPRMTPENDGTGRIRKIRDCVKKGMKSEPAQDPVYK